MSSPSNAESLRARLDEQKLVADRSNFGMFLFNLMYGINKAELVKKTVNLSANPEKSERFRYFSFKPTFFALSDFAHSGEVAIRNGILPGRPCENTKNTVLNRMVEIVYFDGFMNDPFRVPAATLATVDRSLVPRTPLGDVRERTVLDDLIVITNEVIGASSTATPYLPGVTKAALQPINADY